MCNISLDRIINLQNKLVPEMVDLLTERYKVLRQISHDQPIGRRTLAKKLGLSERILRSHVDFLKEAGLLDFTLTGMSITEEGAVLLQELRDYVNRLQKLSSLERILQDKLHLQKVVVLPGNAAQDKVVTREIGRVAAGILLRLLADHKKHIVAVTGGTTVAAMAENTFGNEPETVVVPARGGLGDKMELQATTIATVLAGRLKTRYLQLYVPDSVSEDVLRKILEEDARVKQVVETIKSADILVHGMGQAQVMAEKRGMDPQTDGPPGKGRCRRGSPGAVFRPERPGGVQHRHPGTHGQRSGKDPHGHGHCRRTVQGKGHPFHAPQRPGRYPGHRRGGCPGNHRLFAN